MAKPPAEAPTAWGRADAAATVRAARTRLAALLRQEGPGHLDKLDAIAAVAAADASRVDGAPSLITWVAAQLGCSKAVASTWVQAARRINSLPLLRQAIAQGHLAIDKALQVARYATPETEQREIAWAKRACYAAIKAAADKAQARKEHDAKGYRHRQLDWWFGPEKKTVCLEACLPAIEGKLVIDNLREIADRLPDPVDACGEDAAHSRKLSLKTRMADALIEAVLHKPAPDYAQVGAGLAAAARQVEVVIDVSYDDLVSEQGGCEADGIGAFSAELARRFLCEGPFRVAFKGQKGELVALSTRARLASAAIKKALRRRHKTCCFPGCPARRNLIAHHILFAGAHYAGIKGQTELSNLVLVCAYHHRLIHHDDWGVELDELGNARWYTPYGALYDPPDCFIPYDYRIDHEELGTVIDPSPPDAFELKAERLQALADRRAVGLKGFPHPSGWDEVEDPVKARKEKELAELEALFAAEELAADPDPFSNDPPGGPDPPGPGP
jgi:hypothetical protein